MVILVAAHLVVARRFAPRPRSLKVPRLQQVLDVDGVAHGEKLPSEGYLIHDLENHVRGHPLLHEPVWGQIKVDDGWSIFLEAALWCRRGAAGCHVVEELTCGDRRLTRRDLQ